MRPWTVATLKHDLPVVGRQGTVTDAFTARIRRATVSYLGGSASSGEIIEP